MQRHGSRRVAEPSAKQSHRSLAHVAGGPRARVLSLQRAVGNRATSNLIEQRERAAEKPSLARAPKPDRAKVKTVEPIARSKAKELITKAKQVEPRVTRTVQALAFSRRGKTRGLEYRIKSEESLARKLRDKALASPLDPATAVQKEADSIRDALRYTVILQPDDTYGHLFAEIGEQMKLFNYKADLR